MNNLFNTIQSKKWKKIKTDRRAGSIIPISYLRTNQSQGIGDFFDLYQFIDIAEQRGESLIQILPINDPGPDNYWPYSAISGYALNPALISIINLIENPKQYFNDITSIDLAQITKVQELLTKLAVLNKNEIIDYPAVYQHKLIILDILFKTLFPSIKPDLENFIKKNKWLKDYALFLILAEQENSFDWNNWKNTKNISPNTAYKKKLLNTYAVKIYKYAFIQYIAYFQINTVKLKSNQKNIFLIGDIPIMASRNSADVWANQDYFLLNYSVGAPPDMFSKGGQEWGAPPLNLENKEAVEYFISKFKTAENYMDLVRIDHVLGLFRVLVWDHLNGSITTKGFFYPQKLNKQNVCISEKEFNQLGLNSSDFKKFAGIITDVNDLGYLAEKLVNFHLAQYLDNKQKIEWLPQKELQQREYKDPKTAILALNEDDFIKKLSKLNFSQEEIDKIIKARRRLNNFLCPYFASKKDYCLTFYGFETWQYINLTNEAKHLLCQFTESKRREQYNFWQQTGKDFIKQLSQSTKILLCGEDLGLVDPYIPETLAELGIPGMNVIRWNPSKKPNEQRYLTIQTLSTHDTSPLAEWWQTETSEEEKRIFWTDFLEQELPTPEKLTLSDLKQTIYQLYKSSSLFVLTPIWESYSFEQNKKELRFNTPGTTGTHNWLYRLNCNLNIAFPKKNNTANKKILQKYQRC